jgi:hypothetical protein
MAEELVIRIARDKKHGGTALDLAIELAFAGRPGHLRDLLQPWDVSASVQDLPPRLPGSMCAVLESADRFDSIEELLKPQGLDRWVVVLDPGSVPEAVQALNLALQPLSKTYERGACHLPGGGSVDVVWPGKYSPYRHRPRVQAYTVMSSLT